MKKFCLFIVFGALYLSGYSQNIYPVYSTISNIDIVDGNTAVDTAGNLYIPDWSSCVIRKVDIVTGTMSIIAGVFQNATYNGDGIPASTAHLDHPQAVALDRAGNIFIAEYSANRLRKIDATTGLISTIAGTGVGGYNGDNIPANTAQITIPTSVTVDTSGNVYFTELGSRVRKISKSTGLISTLAGTGVNGYNGNNIKADTAKLDLPIGIALDKYGNVYIAERNNNLVRKIDVTTGIISTIAGNGIAGYNGDGIGADTASLNDPWAVAVDANDNVYIAESQGSRIRKVSGGIISTFAGNGTYGTGGDGGPASLAQVTYPRGLCMDRCGNLYISEHANYRIRKITAYDVMISSTNALCFGVCNGTVNASAIGGTSPYNFLWNNGLGSGSSHSNVCAGSQRVLVIDANNCKEDKYVTITQPSNSITINIINVTTQVCLTGGSAGASVTGGTSPYSYSWSGGGSSWSTSGLMAGNYTVTVTDTNNCVATQTVSIVSNPSTINISMSTNGASCANNGSATASPSGGTPVYTYTWSSGGNAATESGLSAGNYSVTVTDANGCLGTQTVSVVNNPYPSAPICMVTADSASQYNIIFWDKTSFTNIDSFIVLREIASNNYQPIASIPYDSLSMFIDTVATLYFPNTGDPNAGTYRYKLKMIDTCGNASTMSPYHNTIYFLNNNGTFYWTLPYTIESAPNPVSSYILLRDNSSNGNWQQVASVAGTQQVVSDPLYTIYQNTATWRVQTQWNISCTPTAKLQNSTQAFSSSYSNTYTNIGISVKNNSIMNLISLYPNPNKGSFILETGSLKNAKMEVTDILGKVVYGSELKKGKNSITTANLQPGSYFIRISSEEGNTVKKLVIE